MTHIDAVRSDMLARSGTRRRRLRPLAKGMLATVVALLGVGLFASPAFAHQNIVTANAPCPSGANYTVTWTIANDWTSTETATVTATSAAGGLATVSGSPLHLPASPATTPPFVSGTVTQVLPATTTGTVSITVAGLWSDGHTANAMGYVTLPSPGCAPGTMAVTKSVSTSFANNAVPAGSSTPVVYTLAVTNPNLANLPTLTGVTVTDPIPSGTTYVAGSAHCPPGTNGPGEPTCSGTESGGTVTFLLGAPIVGGAVYDLSFAVTVNVGDPSETIANTADYTGPGCATAAPGCSSNPVTFTVTTPVVNSAVVTVAKSANTTAVTAGQVAPVSYFLTVGDSAAGTTTTSPTVISDVVPSGLTFLAASCDLLSASNSPTCSDVYDPSTDTVTFTLGAGIVAGATYAVSFQGTVNAGDTTPIVNSANFTGPGCTTPAPGCSTNAVPITVANFSVSKSDSAGSGPVDPGQVVSYTVSATNHGDGPGTITVTDAVPSGTTLTTPAPACPANTASTCSVTVGASVISWAVSNLPSGATYVLTFAVKVNAHASGHITNTGNYTEPGCTTGGGCSTNTTDNAVAPPTAASTGTRTTAATRASAISGATSVHTGEPWAGSTPYVMVVFGLGLSLLGLGAIRRRRRATPVATP